MSNNLPKSLVEPKQDQDQDTEQPSKKRKYENISNDDAAVGNDHKQLEPKSLKKKKMVANETQNKPEKVASELEALMQEEPQKEQDDGRIKEKEGAVTLKSASGEQLVLPINSQNKQFDQEILESTKDESLKDLLKIAEVLKVNQIPAVPATGLVKEEQYTCEVLDGPNLPILNASTGIALFGEEPALVQNFYPNKFAFGKKNKDVYLCNQQIFRRLQPDGSVSFVWIWNNLFEGECSFFNQESKNFITHVVKSGIFESDDSHLWQLKLRPGNLSNEAESNVKPSLSQLVLEAIPNAQEKGDGMNRNIEATFAVVDIGEKLVERKDWSIKQHFTSETKEVRIEKFYQFRGPMALRKHGLNEQFVILFKINHLIPQDENHQASQPYKGLKNEGTTCYLNSLVQTLFFIRAFRNAVYKMPTINGDMTNKKSIPLCLQRIFYNLQLGNQNHVKTFELCHSFGWTTNEINQQQDVNEFNCMFSDQLETQMKDTEVAGTYKNLFTGKLQNVVKCINVDFESTRDEVFNTLQLSVQGNPSIEDSIRQYVAQEKLEGDNQYETEKDGKQDAKKFIRFKELPPVLQISLNRYEFDIDRGMMVKKNQKFKFGDVLDLESVLPAESNMSSQNQINRLSQSQIYSQNNDNNEKVVNRYHLHSILIHRGTTDFGHYYAFIRPNIDDRWFQFNDLSVREVTKGFAIGQGCGGQSSAFEFQRSGHAQFEGTSGQLLERFQENDTNAYMLIYVRQTEREAIMTDKLSIDDQIPSQLQNHFANEEKFRVQIESDRDATQMNSCFVMTAETLREADWDGMLLDTPFALKQLQQYEFVHKNASSHHLYVHHAVTVNEFIAMIKERFFKDEDQITLDDIWLYRIAQPKGRHQQDNQSVKTQTFGKVPYDLKNRHNIPLFSRQPKADLSHWESKGQSAQWDSSNLQSTIHIYLAINPAKLDPKTQKPYRVLSPLNNSEKNQLRCHFEEYTQFIMQTDMDNQRDLKHVYEQFSRVNYQFGDVKSGGRANGISEQEQIRANFIFRQDKEIEKRETEKLAAGTKEVPSISVEEEQPDPAAKTVLVFLKKVKLNENRLQHKGQFFVDLNAPLPVKEMSKQMGMTLNAKTTILVEPQTNAAITQHDSSGKPLSSEQLGKRGVAVIDEDTKTFALDLAVIQNIPAKEFLKADGAILNLYNDEKSATMTFEAYAALREHLVNRLNVTLFFQKMSDQYLGFQQMEIGTFEFNMAWTYEVIVEKISEFLHQAHPDYARIGPDYIRVFSKDNVVISYKDFMKAHDTSIYLGELVTPYHCLNFTISSIPFQQNDKLETVRYRYFDSNRLRPVRPGNQDCAASRQQTLKDFTRDFQKAWSSREIDPVDEDQNEQQQQRFMLAHVVDSRTFAIKNVLHPLNSKLPMTHFVLEKGQLSWIENRLKLLRLTSLTHEEHTRIRQIFQKNGFDDIMYVIVQVQDQARNNLGEQFLVPISRALTKFNDLTKYVRRKLTEIKEGGDFQLKKADVRNYNLFLANYHQDCMRSRQGRITSRFTRYDKLLQGAFVDLNQHGEYIVADCCLNDQLRVQYDMDDSDWQFLYVIAQVNLYQDQISVSDLQETSNNEQSNQMSLKAQKQEEESATNQSFSTGHGKDE